MDAVGTLLDRRERVGHRQTSVPVPMPVDLHVFAAVVDHLSDEAHQLPHPERGRVAHGVGQADASGAALDRRRVQRLQGRRTGPGRVLGHVHHFQPLIHGKGDRLGRRAKEHLESPSLRVLPNRRATDEGAHLHLEPGGLGHLHDGGDIGLSRSGRRSWEQWEGPGRRSRGPAPGRPPSPSVRRPGRPMSAAWIPISTMRCSISIFRSIGGSLTVGFWRPSRRVSSSSSTCTPA